MLDVALGDMTYRSADGGAHKVLDSVRFQVNDGEFVCLTGPSGCGKTTILRIILGLETDFAGSVSVDGQDGRIGVVFQEPRLLPWRSVEQNVRMVLPEAGRDRDLAPLFRALGLESHCAFFPSELSLGLARRVAIARAFAVEPSLLLLDEPFVSLDEPTAERLRALLLSVWSQRPTAALMVTHNLNEALELADRIVVLSERPTTLRGDFAIPLARQDRDAAALADLKTQFEATFPAQYKTGSV